MEFIRALKPSHDIPNFYHLTTTVNSLGKPFLLPKEESPYKPIDLKTYLKQEGSIEIEIGCGKGNFSKSYCKQYPKTSFIAIEQNPRVAYIAAKKLQKNDPPPHALLLHGDAFYFLRDYLKPNTIKAFHMYFPDPWPKKKHLKNRLLQHIYLEQIKRVALPNASFYWRTDHQEYHQSSMEIFQELNWIIPIEEPQKHREIQTLFEKRYLQEGRPIYNFTFKIEK